MNRSNSATSSPLDGYMTYFSEEGVDFDRFVEQGGQLVGREHSAYLALSLLALPEKIIAVREAVPRLARQLEFLADLFDSESADLSELIWNECAFALIYATKESDLIPDEIPEIGYLDDAAVADAVFTRHAEVFARHRGAFGFDWPELRPDDLA